MNRRTFLKTTGIGAVGISTVTSSKLFANEINNANKNLFKLHKGFKDNLVCVYFRDDHFLEVGIPKFGIPKYQRVPLCRAPLCSTSSDRTVLYIHGSLAEVRDADFVYRRNIWNVTTPTLVDIFKNRYFISGIWDSGSYYSDVFCKHMNKIIKEQYPNKTIKNQYLGTTTDLTGYSTIEDSRKTYYKIRKTYMAHI